VPPRTEEEEEVNGTIELASRNGSIQPSSPKRGRGRPRKNSSINGNATMAMEVAIPVREKKSSVKRPTRGDGATVLVQHEKYSVQLLPSTPRELRREGTEYRGALGAGHHALAVTRKSAYIWDYTAHSTVSSPRIFDVPFAGKDTDPPPFGALVTTVSGTDFGLLLISADTGEVFYYESIERAASLGLFQDRKTGVVGTVGAFYSGEHLVDLTNADHAGFIVTLSSGRIAQLTLRDAQGRAKIHSQFLKATEPQQGGFFGGLKGLLGSSGWTKDVAAVRTRPLGTRGQMQVVSLTVRGEIQLWDLDWSGQYAFRGTIDARELLVAEMKKLESPELEGRADYFSAVDFAILKKPSTGNEVTTLAAELPLDLAVLIRTGSLDAYKYALAEMSMEGSHVVVTRILELDTYAGRSEPTPTARPRLVLPKAHHTAFVSFPDAIIVAALEESQLNSPEAQLHASYVEPAPFEDTIYLKQDNRFAVVGICDEENKANHASVIVFVKGAGLIRITAVDPDTIARLPRVPAKSKIEQAIFHGAFQDGNIIDFLRANTSSSTEEVANAALEISDEILTSTSPFISTTPTSIELHLASKARALEALVRHVRQTYPALGHATMWQLLWDAERVAAAQQMWKTFEDHVATSSQKKRTATILDELCGQLTQALDPEQREAESTDDTVHNFFIHHLQHIEKVFPAISRYLQLLGNDDEIPPQKKLQSLLQSNELWNRTLETVFAFRTDHAASYGILPEFIEDGIVIDVAEYVDLPEFWTSTESMLKASTKMGPLSRDLVQNEYDKIVDGTTPPEIPRIGDENPLLIESMCHIFQERIYWLSSRPGERERGKAEKLQALYEQTRHDEFRSLAALAQTDAGMRLAEKYKDMLTLTEMIVSEVQYALEEKAGSGNQEDKRITKYIAELTARTTKYFDKYGDDWANAYFDFGFGGSHAGIMLQLAQENWPEPLTRYLRAESSRAKLCWIDDIWATKDFKHARECLNDAAYQQETQLWAKKTELSMSKLCSLALQEGSHSKSSVINGERSPETPTDRDLEIVRIQELLFLHFLPHTRSCLDDQARLEVTMQKYGYKNQDLHALKKVLEAGVERVLLHIALSVDELIDVLTLMDSHITGKEVEDNLQGREFYLALKALNAAAPAMPEARRDLLLQLIWKRCYVYDNWVEINSSLKDSSLQMLPTLKRTTAWRTIFYAMEDDLFNTASHVRFLSPSECLGGGCSPEELEYRWSEHDILHPILNDNKIQDEQLRGFVNDRRIDSWVKDCYDTAKNEVDVVRARGIERARHEREFEEAFEREASKARDMNGHAKGPNGVEDDESDLYENGDGDAGDIDLYRPGDGDEDGDVEME
jgi:nuclear pore complex protein Nup133